MNKIIINEADYVKKFLENSDEKPEIGFYYFLNLVSKYYAELFDNYEETVNAVDALMYNIYKEEYIKEKWYSYILSIFQKIKKGTIYLSKRKDIVVYTWDMCQVFKGVTDRERKLLFSAYVTAHYMGYEGWLNTKTNKDIANWFEMANVNCTMPEKFAVLGELRKKGLIETAKKCDNLNIKVPMLSDYFGETPAFRITSLENLGNLLVATYKDGYKQCSCGKLVKIKSNSQTMCKSCASKAHLAQVALSKISTKS